MYSRDDKIYVKINKVGYIPFIGMCGPIPNPIKIPTSTCLQMVTAGIDVFEVDPKTKEMVKLTVQNVFDDEKFRKRVIPMNEQPKPSMVKPTDSVVFSGVTKNPENDEKKTEDDTQKETIDEAKNDVPSVEKPEEKSDEEKTVDNTTEKPQHTQNSNDYKNKNKNKNRK